MDLGARFALRDPRVQAAIMATVLDRSSIVIARDGVAGSVEIADVLAEMDAARIYDLQHAFRAVLAFYAGQGRRLEIGAFRRFCSEPFDEVIRQLEDVVADRLADVGKAGVDFISDEAINDFPDADRVVLRRLLRQPYREARQDYQRAFKIIGSVLHRSAPLWLLSLLSGSRPS
jgi:hypothetical protein